MFWKKNSHRPLLLSILVPKRAKFGRDKSPLFCAASWCKRKYQQLVRSAEWLENGPKTQEHGECLEWLLGLSGGCSRPRVMQDSNGSAFNRAGSLRTTWIWNAALPFFSGYTLYEAEIREQREKSCKAEDHPLLRNGSTRRPRQEGWVLLLLGPEATIKPRCSRFSQASLQLLSGQQNHIWSLPHQFYFDIYFQVAGGEHNKPTFQCC